MKLALVGCLWLGCLATGQAEVKPPENRSYAQALVRPSRELLPGSRLHEQPVTRHRVESRPFPWGGVRPARESVQTHEPVPRQCDRQPAIVVHVWRSYEYLVAEHDAVEELRREAAAFFASGRQWGKWLRADGTGWPAFRVALQGHVIPAPEHAQTAFRNGFIEGFDGNAEALYERAFRQAGRRG